MFTGGFAVERIKKKIGQHFDKATVRCPFLTHGIKAICVALKSKNTANALKNKAIQKQQSSYDTTQKFLSAKSAKLLIFLRDNLAVSLCKIRENFHTEISSVC